MKTVKKMMVYMSMLILISFMGSISVSADENNTGDFHYRALTGSAIEIIGYVGKDTDIKIPAVIDGKKVTKIASSAFAKKNLTSVAIPDGVTEIGSSAFSGCNDLISVEMPDSVINIKQQAFKDCYDLKTVEIPKGVREIGMLAFNNCAGLTSIRIPSNVETIGHYSFSECANLATVEIEDGVKNIVDYAFSSCYSLTTVTIPPSVIDMGELIFASCHNVSIRCKKGSTAYEYVNKNTYGESLSVQFIREKQELTGTDFYAKKVGDSAFTLDMKSTGNGKLSYKSNNAKVVTVSGAGIVTIAGAGETTITVTAEETDEYFEASKDIKIRVTSNNTGGTTTPPSTGGTSSSGSGNSSSGQDSSNPSKPNNPKPVEPELKPEEEKPSTSYTITYKLNNGKNNSKNPSEYYDEKVTLKAPTRKGYIFKGWYTDNNSSEKITSIPKGIEKNYVLYAKWSKVTVKPTAMVSVKNNKKGQITLKYKKVSGAKGYEISYTTDSKFTKKITKKTTEKTTDTIKKLKKGKTYYIKTRAYKLDSTGKKVYGKYTKVEKINIVK